MSGPGDQPVGSWVVAVAITGTVAIAAGAFWLSYTALADLAVRSGVRANQAWVWPLIVDGVIVVATVSVVALHGASRHLARYPWVLLIAGAAVSVAANVIHATLAVPDTTSPALVSGLVAAIPPAVLLAITHLTVQLTHRHRQAPVLAPAPDRPTVAARRDTSPGGVPRRSSSGKGGARAQAARLRAEGFNDSSIARQLGVHRTTVARWLAAPASAPPPSGRAAHLRNEPDHPALAEKNEGGSS